MPRRPPPSALRLFQGPLPPRSEPKHRLPSVPSPTFYPKGALPRQPSPPPGVKPNFARVAYVDSLLAVPKPVVVCAY
ncbi:hypothetical protein EDD16DRAFT_1588052 [Pisolithus croceorrhizus]|nr:hypothetical protein EDD16DRAFT_1588052 [Pisolithus croceorrhizus]